MLRRMFHQTIVRKRPDLFDGEVSHAAGGRRAKGPRVDPGDPRRAEAPDLSPHGAVRLGLTRGKVPWGRPGHEVAPRRRGARPARLPATTLRWDRGVAAGH